MKKLITIIIIFISTYCYGQMPNGGNTKLYVDSLTELGYTWYKDVKTYSFNDTIPIKVGKGLLLRDTTISGKAVKVIEVDTSYYIEDNVDTIPVIMLVCDTNTMAHTSMGFFHTLDQATNDRRIPFWIRGYYIKSPSTWANHKYIEYYLDETKKPLIKTFIIWQVKYL